MPRPAQTDLRERLIDEAEAIIAGGGLASLTARTLAAQAGCAVGSIYNAFRDLDDLILAVHARTLDRLGEALAAEQGRALAPKAKLLAMAERYIGFIERNPHAWLALFEHRLPDGRDVPGWYQAKLNALFAIVEDIVDPLVDGDRAARRREARILWASLQGICALGATDKLDLVSEESVRALAESMITTHVAGLERR